MIPPQNQLFFFFHAICLFPYSQSDLFVLEITRLMTFNYRYDETRAVLSGKYKGSCTHIISLLENLQEKNNYKQQQFSLWIRLSEILPCNNKWPELAPFSLKIINTWHNFTLFLKAWYLFWLFKRRVFFCFVFFFSLNKYFRYFHREKCIGLH